MKFMEKMPKSLLIRLVISYLMMMAGFVYYLMTKDYWSTFIIVFIGFLVIGSGVLQLLPKTNLLKKRKTVYIPKSEPKKTMADIKGDIEQMQEVWDELGEELNQD